MRVAWLALGLALTVLFSGAAWAQNRAEGVLQLQTNGPVAVGDVVQLQLSASSAEQTPSDPEPGPTPGFDMRGHNSMTGTNVTITNGTRTDRYTLTAVWALQAKRPGTYKLGPALFSVGSARYRTTSVTVKVVPAGQAPRRPNFPPGFQDPFGMSSPFDLWKNLMPGFDNGPPQAPSSDDREVDPSLSLPEARGEVVFLHATVDKTSAVVGEQVTFSVYQYIDLSLRGRIEAQDLHDADAADFAKHPILREDQSAPLVGYAAVGGRTWEVRLVARWALFPLRSGALAIGPMRLTVTRPALTGNRQRTTEPLVVNVTEPPLSGRPAGYALGDVGRFALSATVTPRQVEQGGAVAVHVELAGTGNLPSALVAPAREGVEWLTPETSEQLAPNDKGVWGGKRNFDFVVRMHRPGAIDLGRFTLPFWSPDRRRYETTQAELGTVQVSPSAAAAAAEAAAEVDAVLPNLPPPRDSLEGSPGPRVHLDDTPWFWLFGVCAPPLAFGLAAAGRASLRRLQQARRSRRQSPITELREKLAAAHHACRAGDARSADAAIARALEAAALAHAGVQVRGALGREVAERLEGAGVTRGAASDVADLLRECEAARFAPETADIAAARDRWTRAQGAIRSLEKSA